MDTEIKQYSNAILNKLCIMHECQKLDQEILLKKLDTILNRLENIKPPKPTPGVHFQSGNMDGQIHNELGYLLDGQGFLNEDDLKQLPNKIYTILRKFFDADESCQHQPITIKKPTVAEYYLTDDQHETIMFEYMFELDTKYRITIHVYMDVNELDPVYQTMYYNVWLTKYKYTEG